MKAVTSHPNLRGSTFCWITNRQAAAALGGMPGMRVVRQVPFGGVDLIVAQWSTATLD